MARNVLGNGRNKKEAKHVRIYWWEIDSEAYRAADPYERSLYVEIKYRFNGRNNGDIHMSVREAARLLNCGNGKASRVLNRLVELGFIKISQKGAFSRKNKEATTYALTSEPVGGQLATKEFRYWKPDSIVVS